MKFFKLSLAACLSAIIPAVAFIAGGKWTTESGGGDLYAYQPSSFVMENTDILGYDLKFVQSNFERFDIYANPGTIFSVAFQLLMPSFISSKFKSDVQRVYEALYSKKVDILDARERDDLHFNETGFGLLKIDELRDLDWDSEQAMSKFEAIMKPYMLSLYPSATRFVFNPPLHRGGGNSVQASIQKRVVDVPHADYAPFDEEWEEFNELYPTLHDGQKVKRALLGQDDSKDDDFKMILGLWVPTRMKTPVCDRPFVAMDLRTSKPTETTTMATHTYFPGALTHHLSSLIKYHPEQKWYYYSYQEPNEVFLFHQYSKDKSRWANPHTGIYLSGCDSDVYDERSSTEFRVAIFFPKEEEENKQ